MAGEERELNFIREQMLSLDHKKMDEKLAQAKIQTLEKDIEEVKVIAENASVDAKSQKACNKEKELETMKKQIADWNVFFRRFMISLAAGILSYGAISVWQVASLNSAVIETQSSIKRIDKTVNTLQEENKTEHKEIRDRIRLTKKKRKYSNDIDEEIERNREDG